MRLLFPGLRCKSDNDIHFLTSNKQVRMTLEDEDTEDGLHFDPGSHGMNVPSTCTIVIMAGTVGDV